MDMKYYYKTCDGKVVELKQQDELYLCYMDIVELVIPDGCKIVSCYENQLNVLILPDGCKEVWCYNNQLKELVIPNGCKEVYCCYNQLKEFIVPNGCGKFWADMKSITKLNKIDNLRLFI